MSLIFGFLTVTIAASIVKPALAYVMSMLHSPKRGEVIPLGTASPFINSMTLENCHE